MVVPESGWDEKVQFSSEELKGQLEELAQNCKDKMLEKVSQTAKKTNQEHIQTFLHDKVGELSEQMAANIKDAYC